MIGERFFLVLAANVKMVMRNRGGLFFSLFFPLLFMVIFGLIFGNSGTTRSKLDTVGSGPLIPALAQTGAVDVHEVATAAEARKAVKDGRADGALVVAGGQATLYYSNTYPAQAAALRGLVRGVADSVSLAATGRPPAVRVDALSVESASLKYIDFLVPGLLAMALCQSAVFGIAGALVSYRERGIFRRLRVTPLPLGEFAAARIVAMLLLALAQTVVLLAVGRIAFGIHLGIDVAALVPLVVLGALCFITVGFLIGAVSRTQDTAAALGNVITLPMVFLAGVFFPLTTAPAWLREVSRFLPLTYLADGLRDVAIRGHSIASTATALLVLGSVTVAVAAVSVRVFRWD
ncbi:MAG TPA: ABC transporter permease [Gaiellaceae bacterium]|nr:ABC transporter permease [Gaiellaceae bacterium]